MCHHEGSTFANLLANVPDPRHRRGIRHAWSLVLLLISLGLLNQHQTLEGISDWVQEHADQLQEALYVARVILIRFCGVMEQSDGLLSTKRKVYYATTNTNMHS